MSRLLLVWRLISCEELVQCLHILLAFGVIPDLLRAILYQTILGFIAYSTSLANPGYYGKVLSHLNILIQILTESLPKLPIQFVNLASGHGQPHLATGRSSHLKPCAISPSSDKPAGL